ncbi:hypothetical protein [Nocardia sp. NPDC051463]|uniref:Acg family FMN-binding oxidoreductase n=1 Tax=Nocardia sp. NPDC051463 TaxID=3154845 RepID=UPI0034179EFE
MTSTGVPSAPAVPDHPAILAALRLASRAPSVHNTQPWRWVFDGVRLNLYRDPDRQLTAADPLSRQLVISCGAMLHHVRTALAAQGWHTDTVRLPEPTRPEYLAALDFRPWPDPPEGIRARARAIERRRTDRLPMGEPHDWPQLVHAARMLVTPHELEFDVLDDSASPQLAAASEQTKALRRYDMSYQTELHWWAGHADTPEGVPTSSLVSDEEFSRVSVGRTFPSAPHSMRRAEMEDKARLLVLSSPGESIPQWLHTGEALSAVLLECTAIGLSTCALTHVTELPATRKILAGMLTHPGVPQVVIRVGTAPEADDQPPTPRRPLSDILEITRP